MPLMTDEDFFGPVSKSFLLSGRPLDSGISDDGNHDMTLDSETFSRHFRSIAPPDDCSLNSIGSLRTPNSASVGPSKELTGSGYDGKSCNSQDALTNMSLLADNPERYDYAKLSPTLSNLLQKVKDVHEAISPKNDSGTVTPVHSSALVASKEKSREDKLSICSVISFGDLDAIGPQNHGSTMSVPSNSIPQRHVKKAGQTSSLGTPRLGIKEVTKIQEMPCNFLIMEPSHERNSIQDSDGGERKRSIDENDLAEQECPLKISKAPRSPTTSLKQLPCVSLYSSMVEENQSDACGNEQSIHVDWSKIMLMVSNATSQVFSTSLSRVKPQQLDMIEDMLGKIQRARNFKRLFTAVRIQDCCNDKQKRLAEARSLIDKLLYEKAKLQINRVKLEKLQNKAWACQDRIQECRYLKSKISDLKGAPVHATTLITASDRQERLALITEKKLALDMIKKKVERSRSSLEYFCTTKGDISCDDFIVAAEQQLEMRSQCRIIHQQAWLWELNDLVKRENKCDIVLNYCSLLFQRITLNINDMSLFVNNSLSGSIIGQKFPNLNAPMAFNFVLKAEVNQRVSDLRSLQKKTMETSLLLSNLIDVLVEIKIAKMELLNLTAASFNMESKTCPLASSLCFMNFKSGKRISFSIDMADLNRGIYPSEPSELLIKVHEAQTTVAQPGLDKFMSSLRDLQPGRLMILRLCRMASKLMYELRPWVDSRVF
uniref:Uncharacterized protein n=1 Tax=Oryza brachyantha TaxID=4533 RepID=J3MFP6_ORYBR